MKRRLLHKIDTEPLHIFNNATALYTVWNVFGTWTNAILKIRRSSDNATAFVYFNGDTVNLSSLISTSSDTTPDATTLGTWIGSSNGFVEKYYSQFSNNTIGHYLEQLTSSLQPTFITSGIIETENSLPTINFTSTRKNLIGTSLPALNSGSDFSIFTVNSNKLTSSLGIVFSTTDILSGRLLVANDRRSSPKRVAVIQTDFSAYNLDLIAQQNSSTARLLSLTVDSLKNMEAFYNNISQSTNIYEGNYDNELFQLGQQSETISPFPLEGTISFFAVIPQDLNAGLTTYNTFINDYYSIY